MVWAKVASGSLHSMISCVVTFDMVTFDMVEDVFRDNRAPSVHLFSFEQDPIWKLGGRDVS